MNQDVHLCLNNFETYHNLIKNDLSKFEASSFTIEEIKLFEELYSILLQNREKFKEERQILEENFEQFNLLIDNFIQTNVDSNIMFDVNLLRKFFEKLTVFNVLYSAKYNNIFMRLINFYKVFFVCC